MINPLFLFELQTARKNQHLTLPLPPRILRLLLLLLLRPPPPLLLLLQAEGTTKQLLTLPLDPRILRLLLVMIKPMTCQRYRQVSKPGLIWHAPKNTVGTCPREWIH